FVFFLHLGKVGEQPNGPESARSRVARVEKFLDGVGCVRAVAENLLDRGVARPLRGKRLARLFELLGRLLLRATGLDEARLRIANGRIEFSRAELGSLENEISGIDALRERREFTFNAADRGGPVLLGGGVMRGRFLGLLRFGLFAGGFLYEASRNLAELFDARLKLLLFGDTRGRFFGGLAQRHFESRCLPAKSAGRVALHGDSRGEVGGLALGLFDFNREPQGA